jgi:hypothetical protein
MGLFDYVSFEEPIPEFPIDIIPSGPMRPQTKTFEFPYMEDYVVRDRKLYVHRKEFEGTGQFEERTIGDHSFGTREVMKLVREWDEQIPYHGDMELSCSRLFDKKYVRLVARFTEGELQWIKTEEEYSLHTGVGKDD